MCAILATMSAPGAPPPSSPPLAQIPPVPNPTGPPPPGSTAPTSTRPANQGAWHMPLAGMVTALGLAFLIVGLFAMASSADVGAIGRSDEEKALIQAEKEAELAAAEKQEAVDDAREDAVKAPLGGAGQDVYADPEPQATIPGDGEGDGFTVDCSQPGVCTVESDTGEKLFFADDPSRLPEGTEPGDSNVLVPNPEGGISGFKVNPDGSLELVPRGEEDADTYGMAFGPDGSVELLEPGDKPGRGTDLIPGNPGQRERGAPIPDLGAPQTIETPKGDITVECGEGGCRITGENGDEFYMMEEGAGGGSGLSDDDLLADGKALVPSPNGDIAGFRINEDGELELVPLGEEDENTIGLGFGADGSVELLEPGQQPGLGTDLVPGDPSINPDVPDWNGADPGAPGAPGFGPGAEGAAPFDPANPGNGPFVDPAEPGAQGLPDGNANNDGPNNNGADNNENDNGSNDDGGNNNQDDGPSWFSTFFGRWTVILGAVLIGLGVLAAVLSARRRNPKPAEAPTMETIEEEEEEVVDDALHEELIHAEEDRQRVAAVDHLLVKLRSEPDPRRAIQVAYAAVETGFGRADLAKSSTDTPAQYLDRALGRKPEARGPLFELTGLFELARYSNQPVDEAMRARAIAALIEVRDLYSVTGLAAGAR